MKYYKKYITIKKGASFKYAYYNDGCFDIYCGSYTMSYTNKEIKQDVIDNLKTFLLEDMNV